MDDQRPLIIVVGRAASGKDTFVGKIKSNTMTMAKSHTTRPKRYVGENTHIFIDSIEDYSDRILETKINGYDYFLTKKDLELHDILVIDPRGVFDILELEDFKRPFEIIYIDTDRPTRQIRYMKRENGIFADFVKRDISEDSQFTKFEKFISNKKNKQKYNISVLKGDKEIEKEILRIKERR